jgi:hypothetical protein
MNDNLKQELTACMKTNTLVSIFSNELDTTKFSAGYIQRIGENHLILNHFSTTGAYDGFLTKNIDDIIQITKNGKYEKKIEKLYNLKNQPAKKHKIIPELSENIFTDLISFAEKENLLVALELKDSGRNDVLGLVSEINGTLIKIKVVDDYGEFDGESIIDVEDITFVECDSEDLRNVQLIMSNV